MVTLVTRPAEVRFTLDITSASTGEIRQVEMVGYIVAQTGENECQ